MYLNKFIFPALIVILLSWLVIGCGQGEQSGQTADTPAAEQGPGVERTSIATLSAVVEAVDYEARTVTLKDETGNTQTLKVRNPNVPLENLKAGDEVTMTIYQEEVAYVAAPDEEIPSEENIKAVGTAKEESGGEITVMNAQQRVSTVEAVDVENRIVTLVDAEGTPLTLPVQDDVKNLDKLKVGDTVVTQTMQVVTISIVK